MLAINAAPGREQTPPPWPRLRPALGLAVAFGVLGYYGSKIGDEVQPQLTIQTDAPVAAGPVAEFVVEAVTPRDFQVVVRTGVCTTVEFTWTGPSDSGAYSIGSCVSAHILSPPVDVRLVPGTEYKIEATFTSSDDVQSSFEYLVTTKSD